MTTFELFVVIAAPIVINSIFTATLFIAVNSRISDLRSDMVSRFTNLEKLMDLRFESLERQIHTENQ